MSRAEFTFSVCLTAMQFAAGVVFVVNHRPAKGLYWVLASVLTYLVCFVLK